MLGIPNSVWVCEPHPILGLRTKELLWQLKFPLVKNLVHSETFALHTMQFGSADSADGMFEKRSMCLGYALHGFKTLTEKKQFVGVDHQDKV